MRPILLLKVSNTIVTFILVVRLTLTNRSNRRIGVHRSARRSSWFDLLRGLVGWIHHLEHTRLFSSSRHPSIIHVDDDHNRDRWVSRVSLKRAPVVRYRPCWLVRYEDSVGSSPSRRCIYRKESDLRWEKINGEDLVTNPNSGFTAMPRGFWMFLSSRTFRKLPSSLATSKRFNAESVQNTKRETQSTAIASGLPSSEKKQILRLISSRYPSKRDRTVKNDLLFCAIVFDPLDILSRGVGEINELLTTIGGYSHRTHPCCNQAVSRARFHSMLLTWHIENTMITIGDGTWCC